jgi:hypothetical protein
MEDPHENVSQPTVLTVSPTYSVIFPDNNVDGNAWVRVSINSPEQAVFYHLNNNDFRRWNYIGDTLPEERSTILCYEKCIELLRFDNISRETYGRISESLHTLAEIYHLFGMNRPYKQPVNKEQSKYNSLYNKAFNKSLLKFLIYLAENGEDQWMAYLKYFTSNFYAIHETENTDLVPAVKGLQDKRKNIFGGVFQTYLTKRLIQRDPKKFREFILTINMSKMGLPRPTEQMVQKKEYETADFLTSPPRPLPPDEILSNHGIQTDLTKANICYQLRRTVREIFQGLRYTNRMHYEPFCPSTNANYNRSRAKGGAVGEFISRVLPEVMDTRINNEIEVEEYLQGDLNYAFNQWDIDRHNNKIELSRGKHIVATLVDADGVCNIESMEIDEFSPDIFSIMRRETLQAIVYDEDNLRKRWIATMDKIKEMAEYEQAIVEPVGLAEALKVRVISKGPPLLYTYLKPLQKFLHSTLRKIDVFQLIGTPVTAEIINKTFPIFDETDMFLNGDYKASTDNLRGWVSEVLVNELCGVLNEGVKPPDNDLCRFLNLPEEIDMEKPHYVDEVLLRRSLTGHLFKYKDGTLKPQTDGQLMGSISSFPFLCLANAALCRWALEISDNKRYRLTNLEGYDHAEKCKLLVNGDDCTMLAKRVYLRKNWAKITNFAGLTTSVGKTLFSLPDKPIVVINSVTYDCEPRYSSNKARDSFFDSLGTPITYPKFVERKYINMGILLGKTRSSISGVDKAKVSYHQLGALHRELYESCPPSVWEEVSKRFIETHRTTLEKCSFIPWITPEYLGGPGLVPDGEVSAKDLRVFSYLIKNCNNPKYKVSKPMTDVEWKFHNLIQKNYERLGVKEVCYDRLRLHNDMLFGGDEPLDYDVDCETESSKFYRLQVVDCLFSHTMKEIFDQSRKSQKDSEKIVSMRYDRTYWKNNQAHSRAYHNCWNDHSLVVRSWDDIVARKFTMEYPVVGSLPQELWL